MGGVVSVVRRIVIGLVAAVLVTAQAVAGAAGAAAPQPRAQAKLLELVTYTRYLSPNADGRHDRARVVFRLADRADVRVVVRTEDERVVKRVQLGKLAVGKHVWRWGGRASGHALPDGRYTVVLQATQKRSVWLMLPIVLKTRPDDGKLLVSRSDVYPQATAVHDRIDAAYLREGYSNEVAQFPQYFSGQWPLRTRFVVRSPGGVRVADVTRRGYLPEFSWAARDGSGEALPAGDYRLRVTVSDRAGNVRTFRRTIEVSGAQLVEQVWTSTTPAATTASGPFPTYDPGCNGCGEVCGAEPSERYVDGLSFRQPCTFGYAAVEYFGATPPFTPAPVDSWRVSATGGPTTPGDTDVGSLSGVTMGPGDVTLTTAWQQVDLLSQPYIPDGTQPAVWSFSTNQENDYDVASFTVEYRYYVPVE